MERSALERGEDESGPRGSRFGPDCIMHESHASGERSFDLLDGTLHHAGNFLMAQLLKEVKDQEETVASFEVSPEGEKKAFMDDGGKSLEFRCALHQSIPGGGRQYGESALVILD